MFVYISLILDVSSRYGSKLSVCFLVIMVSFPFVTELYSSCALFNEKSS